MSNESLANLLKEKRRFAPPAELAAAVNVTAAAYAQAPAAVAGPALEVDGYPVAVAGLDVPVDASRLPSRSGRGSGRLVGRPAAPARRPSVG